MEKSAAEVELIESSGGAFEVFRDGKLLFSKKQLKRFPTDEEIDGFVKT
jgi:selT/selW/selH-like putative selenoprotein